MAIPGRSTLKHIASGPKFPVFHVRHGSRRAKRHPVDRILCDGNDGISFYKTEKYSRMNSQSKKLQNKINTSGAL